MLLNWTCSHKHSEPLTKWVILNSSPTQTQFTQTKTVQETLNLRALKWDKLLQVQFSKSLKVAHNHDQFSSHLLRLWARASARVCYPGSFNWTESSQLGEINIPPVWAVMSAEHVKSPSRPRPWWWEQQKRCLCGVKAPTHTVYRNTPACFADDEHLSSRGTQTFSRKWNHVTTRNGCKLDVEASCQDYTICNSFGWQGLQRCNI